MTAMAARTTPALAVSLSLLAVLLAAATMTAPPSWGVDSFAPPAAAVVVSAVATRASSIRRRRRHRRPAARRTKNPLVVAGATPLPSKPACSSLSSTSDSQVVDSDVDFVVAYKTSVFNKTELAVITAELSEFLGEGGDGNDNDSKKKKKNGSSNNGKKKKRGQQRHKQQPLQLKPETPSSVATNRVGFALPPGCRTVALFRSGSLRKLVQQQHRQQQHDVLRRRDTAITSDSDDDCDCEYDHYELSRDLPVEVRVYGEGSSMAWHVDDVLYDPVPQIEIVWTLENTSDAVTIWKLQEKRKEESGDSDNNDNDNSNIIRSIETDRNSALMLRAGGAPHCVTKLRHGRRVIIKCAFVLTSSRGNSKSKFRNEEYRQQFVS